MTNALELCNVCQSVISRTQLRESEQYHDKCRDLYNSAQRGCSLCTLVWDCTTLCDALCDLEIEDYLDSTRLYVHILPARQSSPLMFHFEFFYLDLASQQRISKSFRIGNIYALLVEDKENTIEGGDVSNTGSEETWTVATEWLDKCCKSHPKCIRTSVVDWMPTRVLDVGTLAGPDLNLYVTDRASSAKPYTTLSHCWGNVQFTQLKTANLETFVNGIDINELPKTFQDAITITRRLAIRYLWIDSLCIIQDSIDDWRKESSIMGEIYQNCFCNIAATGARDGRTGCFVERNPLLARRCRMTIEPYPNACLLPGVYDLVPQNMWRWGVEEAPLCKRAWVLQERLLAPRILHFGKGQLFWECPELKACEMYLDGLPSIFKDPGEYCLPEKTINDPELDEYSALETWNEILSYYIRCNLTKEQDKLVAISAIAKRFQRILKDEYIAGFWKRQLPYNLLWRVSKSTPEECPVKPGVYCAPSWSWASLKSFHILTPEVESPQTPIMIQILSVEMQLVTEDMTGQVSSGCLKLRGWMKRFTLGQPSSAFDHFEFPDLGGVTFAYFDHKIANHSTWWCLPVFEQESDSEVHGLILSETGEKNVYQRAGVFQASDQNRDIFRRPTYPIQQDRKTRQNFDDFSHLLQADFRRGITGTGNQNDGSTSSGKERNPFKNFFTRNRWVERVITII